MMKIIYFEDHKLHNPPCQIVGGIKMDSIEIPERIENIFTTLSLNKHELISSYSYNMEPVLRVHSKDYVYFLKEIYKLWRGDKSDTNPIFPDSFPPRVSGTKPKNRHSQVGWYCYDTTAPILKNTFKSAISSVNCALTGADLLFESGKKVYALCRPPGHHAGTNFYGGFCYLNNAAIAANHLQNLSSKKVAILDIDYHHGNGTQQIFYESNQVLFVSIHADPNDEYPYYSGYSDEKGKGDGTGYNLNITLPIGTKEKEYLNAVTIAVENINQFNPEYLIISLGVDTLFNDPVGGFKLLPDSFKKIGKMLSVINKPVLIIQEGGYLLESIGDCVYNFLDGIE